MSQRAAETLLLSKLVSACQIDGAICEEASGASYAPSRAGRHQLRVYMCCMHSCKLNQTSEKHLEYLHVMLVSCMSCLAQTLSSELDRNCVNHGRDLPKFHTLIRSYRHEPV